MPFSSWLSRGGQSTEANSNDSKNSSGSALLLPPGRSRAIPLLGQTLSFHDSAHDEVTSLIKSTGCSAVRLNVIARNVALVTSYEDVKKVLDQQWGGTGTSSVSRLQAYEQLMAAFYSAPNLLLEDEDMEGAKEHRQYWDDSIQKALQDSSSTVQDRVAKIVDAWLQRVTTEEDGKAADLYDICKDLGHDLALGTFLSLDSNSSTEGISHENLRHWSEEMLRGQFTLPVGVNVGFFQNTFSRGLAAKGRFDRVVEQQLSSSPSKESDSNTNKIPRCPFAINPNDRLSTASLISHHSMFSSSLVVKAFASIASALLLQLFRPGTSSEGSLAEHLCNSTTKDDEDHFAPLLESIITETERLSPPIIGVMRRVTESSGIDLTSSATHIPKGWDIWPYFPLANRDEKVFGSDANIFQADRYLGDKDTPQPLSFGAGVKNCAGYEIVRLWLRQLATSILGRRRPSDSPPCFLEFDTDSIDAGVQSWLGWLPSDQSSPKWAGVKQLPTQRPRKAIPVQFNRSFSSSSS